MKTATAIYTLLLACALACLAPGSCPKKPNPATKPTFDKSKYEIPVNKLPVLPRTFHDDALRVTLGVPEGWTVTKNKNNPIVLLAPPDAGTFGPLANLVIEPLSKSMDPYDYLAASVLTLQASIVNLKIEKWAVVYVNSRMMAWIYYSYPIGSIRISSVAYCQIIANNAYVVTGTAPSDTFIKNEYLYHAIGRSLRVD
jgi:hypothetical protein